MRQPLLDHRSHKAAERPQFPALLDSVFGAPVST
jgi:hypothetical protein